MGKNELLEMLQNTRGNLISVGCEINEVKKCLNEPQEGMSVENPIKNIESKLSYMIDELERVIQDIQEDGLTKRRPKGIRGEWIDIRTGKMPHKNWVCLVLLNGRIARVAKYIGKKHKKPVFIYLTVDKTIEFENVTHWAMMPVLNNINY